MIDGAVNRRTRLEASSMGAMCCDFNTPTALVIKNKYTVNNRITASKYGFRRLRSNHHRYRPPTSANKMPDSLENNANSKHSATFHQFFLVISNHKLSMP